MWANSENTILGHTVLGERGISSEEVGVIAAKKILSEINSGSTLDSYAFDQILPYMAIARDKGESLCIVKYVSSHAKTNMWLIKQFFNAQFESKQIDDTVLITIR